ncbi:heavy-metal-associated domain-containing protein [Streptomyces phytohabitans]|uniref:heavy-metal-associated domain-containing protein n=1 Tax=Streptomyces phytohabitans TaxID=1150371 RepID=UPI00345BD7DE
MSNATTYKVTGMSCDHCERAVTAELTGVEGVSAVHAAADSGLVTVTFTGEPDDEAVREAVDEAGYELVGRA